MGSIDVLCVDPDDDARTSTVRRLREELDAEGVTVLEARTVDEARDALAANTVDCVVAEYDLQDGTGLDLLEHVREVAPDTGYILYTAVDYADVDTARFEDLLTEYVDRTGPRAPGRLAGLIRTTATARVQASYPVPEDESERVAALEAYDLDADALAAPLERVTTLAAAHFDVPRSSVNVITGDQQRYLACYGADWSADPREDSICTFTIVEGGVLAVEDVLEDPRFDGEDLDRKGIRSYLGATLTTPDGEELGTLCVYDESPRSFSDVDRRYLRLLADVAMDLIELSRRPSREADAS